MANRIIDMSGGPWQTCWGCGNQAGGHEGHYYYGNFPFGVEHRSCGQRIKTLLDRSFRALAAMDSEDRLHEDVVKALIKAAANYLGNRVLDTIADDETIRTAIETHGMVSALDTFHSLETMDEQDWQTRLKAHHQVMQGPKEVQKEVANEKVIADLTNAFDEFFERKQKREEECLNALRRMAAQLKEFAEKLENPVQLAPYCILENVIAPYYKNSSGDFTLQKVFEQMNAGQWSVCFLAEERQDPAYQTITHITVEHVAVLPPSTSLEAANLAWKHLAKSEQAIVLPVDCLEWRNHWVFFKEIGERLSVGEGSKERPLSTFYQEPM